MAKKTLTIVATPKKRPRLSPNKTVRTAVAPHVKTTSNGQPRPKKRSK